ncbi:MAG: OmpH family outer membrane protein [Rhodobacteraceae bacterium]|jgi:Skp family chaperone for outer membrane proteins|nr:OmpH family outer membrane protein [Paracoccaceae bacterium]
MRAAIVAAWLLGAGAAFAQAQPAPQVELPPPVLTIDADRLLAESAFGRALAAEVDTAARALAEENRRIETDLLAEERDLTERRAMMSPDEFRPMADAFDEKVQRLRAEQDEKERALADLREEGRQRFFREAVPVLSEIVREQGALVLLDRRDVFLSADAIDITDIAIARIDAAVAPPDVAVPETPAPDATGPEPAVPEAPPAGTAPGTEPAQPAP